MLEHPSDQRPDATSPAGYRLTHNAMATTWELYCFGDEEADCEHAAELAFEEVDAVERQLSFFLDSSDIGRVNEAPPGEPTLVSADAMACLQLCQRVHQLTGGAFDPTVGALLTGREPWHLSEVTPPEGTPPQAPQPDRLGFETIQLDVQQRLVTRQSEQVQLDLGAIGKGFGVDRALEVLADWLEGETMLVAGHSTMRGLGRPSEGRHWDMGIHDPRDQSIALDRIAVGQQAVSAAAAGPSGHVLDPRTGQSAAAAVGAWAVAETGAVSDGVATAALVMSGEQLEQVCASEPTLAIARLTGAEQFEVYGQWLSLRGTLSPDVDEA
jgi:thiamine biosynthesis lipoprotein